MNEELGGFCTSTGMFCRPISTVICINILRIVKGTLEASLEGLGHADVVQCQPPGKGQWEGWDHMPRWDELCAWAST